MAASSKANAPKCGRSFGRMKDALERGKCCPQTERKVGEISANGLCRMTILRTTSLYHEPAKCYVEARIVLLTPKMVEEHLHRKWWNDDCLKPTFNPEPIDRSWSWHEQVIEYGVRRLASEKIGIFAGEDNDLQGAMMISADPVPSVLEDGRSGLFVERLFTAPRNRRDLRRDGVNFLKAVGLELLTFGAFMSRDRGFEGRLLLDASPDFVWWYEQKAHLRKLDREPILYEGVKYTPMELPASGAQRLLSLWKDA
jgi:hypothetical protein